MADPNERKMTEIVVVQDSSDAAGAEGLHAIVDAPNVPANVGLGILSLMVQDPETGAISIPKHGPGTTRFVRGTTFSPEAELRIFDRRYASASHHFETDQKTLKDRTVYYGIDDEQ